MRLGVPKESKRGETRVAATPKTVEQLIKLGYDVTVEPGAGEASAYPDQGYVDAGATLGDTAEVWASDIVAKVNAPTDEEVPQLRSGAILASLLAPALNPDKVESLRAQGVTAMAMDAVPRISRAQSMDALSSMANISGYRAVVEAAHAYGRTFGGQVTAAGKVPPAKVFVIGTGVAGLAALGAANSMGAEVYATDVRPETAEQVQSMGATFLHVRQSDAGGDQGVSSDGYAKETSDDYNARAAELYLEQAGKDDVIITTAAIPGKPSPKLITADMVAAMKPGSVIVDLAALGGGNCELTRPGEKYVTDNGVTIIGYIDLPSRLAGQSSQLYGTNLVNLLKLVTPDKDGQIVLDMDDEVVRTMTVCKDGELLYPPPPVQVAAAPKPAAKAPEPVEEVKKEPRPWTYSFGIVTVLAVVLIALLTFAPASFVELFGTFAIAVVVGYYVVWNVTHALHTPLMSVTNAISGIIIVGAITQLDSGSWAIKIIAAITVLIASINIFGGFTVTQRMLKMFRKA